MFKGLKERLRKVVKKISKKAEGEKEEDIEVRGERTTKEVVKLDLEKKTTKVKEERDKEKEKKKGLFEKIKKRLVTTTIDENRFNDLFFEIEVVFLENNVAFEVVEKIKEELKEAIVGKQIKKNEMSNILFNSLKSALYKLYNGIEKIDLIKIGKEYKPLVILFLGVNGSGKTTTIAKMAHLFLTNNKTVVIAASDTFRAAAIEQLEQHAKKLNVKTIKHNYGADPAAVAYDSVAYAKSKGIDVVLIDTAGRLHSDRNLIDELKKIVRVSKPHLKIFVGEAVTGNDCIEQAKLFNEHIGIDGVILTKADVDEKGGAALSISYIIKKPIIYLGVGQGYDDLIVFSEEKIIEGLFS